MQYCDRVVAQYNVRRLSQSCQKVATHDVNSMSSQDSCAHKHILLYFRDCRTTIPLSSLKVSCLDTIFCGLYEFPNEQNRMCELRTFSQIRSHIIFINDQCP